MSRFARLFGLLFREWIGQLLALVSGETHLNRVIAVCAAGLLMSTALARGENDPRANALLHRALAAQGGEERLRAIQSVVWKMEGYRQEVEQSERPEGPYIQEFDTTDEVHDYAHSRLCVSIKANVPPAFKFSETTVADLSASMRVIGGRARAGNAEQVKALQERLALSPERLLITAIDSGSALLEPDTSLRTVPQRVISFDLDGSPVRIFLNAYSLLPTRVDYSGPMARQGFWAFTGDVTSSTWYGIWWLAKDGVHLPMAWTSESNGLPDRVLVARSVTINGQLDDKTFEIPDSVRKKIADNPEGTTLENYPLGIGQEPEREIAPGIWFIAGNWNVTLVRQDDGVVILEAPISSGYSAKAIAEAQKLFPGIPVKALITTSDSWPHLAGIREYVARGIPIYALDLDGPILERTITAPHTHEPDRLQKSPRKAIFHFVHEHERLASKYNPIELMPMRGPTTERQMMAYFPESRLLYGSDAFQINPDGSYNLPQTVDEVLQAVDREHLDVSRYFMMHVSPSPWSALRAVVEVAAGKDSPSE